MVSLCTVTLFVKKCKMHVSSAEDLGVDFSFFECLGDGLGDDATVTHEMMHDVPFHSFV